MTRTKRAVLAALLTLPALAAGPVGNRDDSSALFAALRGGNGAMVQSLAARRIDFNARNAEGETPLHYAAMYGTAAQVALLLARGADPNAASPTSTTPLMLATADVQKVQLLLDHGADLNAKSVTGRTALLIAASRAGSGDVVYVLLRHGADPNAKDHLEGAPLIPAGAGGSTPLIEAAKIADGQALRLLLDAGADIHVKDNSGADALAAAALNGNLANVELLIERGARVDAHVTVNRFTPLFFAAWRQDARMARLLIDHGADVNATDANGATPLMWSAYSDYAIPDTTRVLLDTGAKLNARNQAGESAITWARRRGDTAIVRLLVGRGAEDVPSPVEMPQSKPARPPADKAAERAVALLQQSAAPFFKVSGCVSCHNQSLPQMVAGMARVRLVHVDETLAEQSRKQVLSIVKPARLPLLENSDVVPDIAGTAPYLLLGLYGDNYAPDVYTDAAVLNLLAKQFPDGSWRPWAPRPPLEFSPVTSTALSIRALQLYAPPSIKPAVRRQIAAAREYLRGVTVRTNEEKAMRLLGLRWSGAAEAEINAAAKSLRADQRPDGGWSQLPTLGSDAYATGQALYALRIAGGLAAADAVYLRGADYLLRSQQADGSWRVVSRSFPFQPYHESGFPHGKDQWISAAGTSWAAMALMLHTDKTN